MNLAHKYRNTELFLPCNRIQVLTLDIETAPVYLPEIIPSSIPTFRELRIIFTKYWGSGTSPEDVFTRRKERIEKIGTMAAQRGVHRKSFGRFFWMSTMWTRPSFEAGSRDR